MNAIQKMARQDLEHTATEIVHGADDPRPCEVLGFCTYAAPDGLEFGIGWKAQIDEGGTVEDINLDDSGEAFAIYEDSLGTRACSEFVSSGTTPDACRPLSRIPWTSIRCLAAGDVRLKDAKGSIISSHPS